MDEDIRRPLLITIMGVLYVLVAFLLILGGISMFAVSSANLSDLISGEALNQMLEILSKLNMSWNNFANTVGIMFTVFGAIYLIAAIGFFRGWKLMWYLGVIVNILALIVNVYSLTQVFTSTAVVSLIITALLLLYLTSGGVRRYFRVSS